MASPSDESSFEEAQVKGLDEALETLRQHTVGRQRTQKTVAQRRRQLGTNDGVKPPAMATAALLVVAGAELGPWVQKWIHLVDAEARLSWGHDHMPHYVYGPEPGFDYQGRGKLGGVNLLALETGYDHRDLERIKNCRSSKFIGLWKADHILRAMGWTYLLHNGSIRIVPNPQMTFESWVARMHACGVDNPEETLT